MLPLPFFIARRFLFAGAGKGYLSLISWFSLIGMALGVAALIIVSSVMNGFERQLQERILNVVPHIFVAPVTAQEVALDPLQSNPAVTGVAPYKKVQAMASYQRYLAGITLNGVEPDSVAAVSRIPEAMSVGDLNLLADRSYYAVIGAGLSRQLGVYVGDKITLVLPQVNLSPAGAFPRSKRFTVAGIFQVGADVDETEVYVHLADLRRLARDQGPLAYRVEVSDVLLAPSLGSELTEQLGDAFTVTDWSATHGSLFQAVKVEKLMVALLLGIIVLVAAFNVVAVLTMMVVNKRSAIAVLRTIGAKRVLVLQSFVCQGVLLGSVGSLCGLVLGLPTALYLTELMTLLGVSLFDADVYYITALPSVVNAQHVGLVLLFALSTSFLATLYPAYRATQVHPSEVLRYE